MKVLFVGTGGSSHEVKLVSYLARRGYEVCYAHLTRGFELPSTAGLITSYLGFISPRGRNWPTRMPAFAATYALSFLALRGILKSFQPDILHGGFIQSAGLLSAMTGFRPFLLSPMGSDVLIYPRRSWLTRVLTRYTIWSADAIICDSDSVRRSLANLAEYPGDQIRVMPWGVDLELFRNDTMARTETRQELGWENNKVVIMTRYLRPVYGVSYFIDCLPAVFRTEPSARALVLGSGPLEGELRSRVQQLGIQDKVRFLGEVPNREMPKYLNCADAYVSSSVSDGTSVSLLEAMACGLPVVVTDVPSNLEWIENGSNGLVVGQRDSERLGEAIIRILRDDRLRSDMSARNRRLVGQKANLSDNLRTLEDAYSALASQTYDRKSNRNRKNARDAGRAS